MTQKLAYSTAVIGDFIVVGERDEMPSGFVTTPPPSSDPDDGYSWRWVNGEWSMERTEPEPEPVSVDTLKVEAKLTIDGKAEAERLKYITSGAGQAMTYQQKQAEAARYLAEENPVPADYPMLAAEVGITAPDMASVAAVVVAAFQQWQTIGAAIEAIRLGAKQAVDAAATVEEIDTVTAAIIWPTLSA